MVIDLWDRDERMRCDMFYSPLRYPGGKGKLEPFMELLIKQTGHQGGVYVEPFAGGAGIALELLEKEVVNDIVINDLDKGIYSFWKAILTETDRFITDRIQIDIVDENDNKIDYRKFRTAWQNDNGRDRFRVIPLKLLDGGKKTEAKMQIPVLYLGLSRLFPIGEANEDKITTNKIKFIDDEQKKWFIEQYAKSGILYP